MNTDDFKDKSILITGGSGSLGQCLLHHFLTKTKARRIAIFSRDELKQYEIKNRYQSENRLRYFLGDIRDQSRLERAMHGVDYVVHAAALKQVDTGEYNPMEFIKTNVLGSQNVIESAINTKVKKVVALSTDKASSPINLYGATKLTSDKLFIAANNYSHAYGTAFSVVRYGNVMGSRGSVIPFFKSLKSKGSQLPITDLRMTRFWISLEDAMEFVVRSFDLMQGGELYVPIIPSFKVVDLAEAIYPKCEFKIIGIRPGEKLHEEMISKEDSRRTFIIDQKRLVVAPTVAEWNHAPFGNRPWTTDSAYSSDGNSHFLSVSDLRKLIS